MINSIIYDEQLIKSAGVFSGLKHLVKKLFSSEYKENIEKLKDQSIDISPKLKELETLVPSIEEAIKKGDVERYAVDIDRLKFLSRELSDALDTLSQSASKVDSRSLLKAIEPPSSRYVDKIYISENVKRIATPRLEGALAKADVEPEIASDILSKDIWSLIEYNLHKNSKILSHEAARPSKVRSDRDNEQWVTIKTEPFELFDTGYEMQVTAVVTDMYSRKSSNTKWSVKNFTSIVVEEGDNLIEGRLAAQEDDSYAIASSNQMLIKQADDIPGSNKKSQEFITELKNVASRLGTKPEWLAAVMMSESGMNASATNSRGGATGLIQFMPSTAEHLGTSVEELSHMSDVDQLKYVEKFYSPYKGKLNSIADLYMATFLPVFVGQPGNTKVGERYNYQNIPRSSLTYHKIYDGNHEAFDKDNKGYFTISDVARRAKSFLKDIPDMKEEQKPKEEKDHSVGESLISMVQAIYDFFMKQANSKDAQIIRKAIDQQINCNDFTIRIDSSLNESLSLKFAESLSIIIESAIDGTDTSIHKDDETIEISFKCAGTKETATLLLYQIIKEASTAFNNKYDTKQKCNIIQNKISSLNKVSYKYLHLNSLKYSFAEEEKSYSSIMRSLSDDEKKSFQETFKKAFDEAVINEDEEPGEKAIEETV